MSVITGGDMTPAFTRPLSPRIQIGKKHSNLNPIKQRSVTK
jgi:hypothetical protein